MKIRFKKKYIVLIVSAVLISVTAYTLAYFTNSDFVTNRFSGQNHPDEEKTVEISVSEQFDPPDEKNDDPFQKNVRIQNTGNSDCYIRVRLEFSSSEIRDISWLSSDDDPENEDAFIRASAYQDSALPNGWEYRAQDGFYYYTEPVRPNQTTSSLIQWVKTVFPDDASVNADEYDIYVYSEAVPADDENGDRLTYEDAWE